MQHKEQRKRKAGAVAGEQGTRAPPAKRRVNLNEAMAKQKAKAETAKASAKEAKRAARPSADPAFPPESYVAMDCEMVGVGVTGKRSVLARAALVGWDGEVLYDKFVRCVERVTDFRTKYSGVRAKDIKGPGAVTLQECQREVAALLDGKVRERASLSLCLCFVQRVCACAQMCVCACAPV